MENLQCPPAAEDFLLALETGEDRVLAEAVRLLNNN